MTETTELTLETSHGMGALQATLDPVRVRVATHEYVGVNYVKLARNSGTRARWAKLYTASRQGVYVTGFTVTGFLNEDAPTWYLFLCMGQKHRTSKKEPKLTGPMLWAMSREEIIRRHKVVRKNGVLPYGESGASIPYNRLDHEGGMVRLSFAPDSKFRVLKRAQLGL